MVSEETIQQAAKVIDGILSADPQVAREMFGDEPDKIARTLAEVGLLAPTPLTEEWTVWGDLPELWGTDETFNSKQSAEQWIRDNEWAGRGGGRAVHRHISDWEAQ